MKNIDRPIFYIPYQEKSQNHAYLVKNIGSREEFPIGSLCSLQISLSKYSSSEQSLVGLRRQFISTWVNIVNCNVFTNLDF